MKIKDENEMRTKIYGCGIKTENIEVFFAHASQELKEILWQEIKYRDLLGYAGFVEGFLLASAHFLR